MTTYTEMLNFNFVSLLDFAAAFSIIDETPCWEPVRAKCDTPWGKLAVRVTWDVNEYGEPVQFTDCRLLHDDPFDKAVFWRFTLIDGSLVDGLHSVL